MQKAVLISISPKWCDLIKSGKKKVEARKAVPIMLPPYKCYIYEPKKSGGSGKVIGEFICDKHIWVLSHPCIFAKRDTFHSKAIYDACLTMSEVEKYSAGKDVYGMTITNLMIYDKPKDLSQFYYPPEKYCEKQLCGGCPYDQVPNEYGEVSYDCEWKRPITRPPQSWCYVAELED